MGRRNNIALREHIDASQLRRIYRSVLIKLTRDTERQKRVTCVCVCVCACVRACVRGVYHWRHGRFSASDKHLVVALAFPVH